MTQSRFIEQNAPLVAVLFAVLAVLLAIMAVVISIS